MLDILSQKGFSHISVYNVTVHDGGEYTILNNCIVNHHSSSNQSTDSPDEQGSQR